MALRNRLLLVLISVIACVNGAAIAQTKLNVQGAGRLYPIAVPRLCIESGESAAVREIPQKIGRNLDISGFFDVIDPDTYIEEQGRCSSPDNFAYSDWNIIGVEGLIRGIVRKKGRRVTVSLFLHDVQSRRIVLGKEYEADESEIKKISDRFSNEVILFFTGEAGIFGTQITFSSKVGRFKELFLMDVDGSGLKQLTNDKGLAISASWSPDSKHIVYTTYRLRVPDLFELETATRQVRKVTSGSALELGGKYSRDGRLILASRSAGRDADIVVFDRQGNVERNLTRGNGVIDVSPDWSPDNTEITFCSNRSGGPQIYVMSTKGGRARRISYVKSRYCTSPVWSPKGGRVAFVCQAHGGYQIYTANPAGKDVIQLTDRGRNEDPAWSPDGRYLVFSSTAIGRGVPKIALINKDGTNFRALTVGRTTDTQPAWSGFAE